MYVWGKGEEWRGREVYVEGGRGREVYEGGRGSKLIAMQQWLHKVNLTIASTV